MKKNIDILAALGLPPLPSTSPDTIAALMWAREVLQKHQTTTYAVIDPKGIEELKPVKIGGVDQWLHIRGRNRNNPVLLFLHGGPGSAEIGGAIGRVQRPWEDYFTVVHWDQRQTGKSYYPADDEHAPLTVQQFIDDAEEVMQYLRDYLEKDKLFILGASWGTVLGMHMVKRHPDWVHAYVSVGQVVNGIDNERAVCERLMLHAKEKNDQALIAKINDQLSALLTAESPQREKAIVDNGFFPRAELSRLGEAGMRHLGSDEVKRTFNLDRLISPLLSLTDLSNAILGDQAALYRSPYLLKKDQLDRNLRKEVGDCFEVPIFFFTGRHDWQTPISLSDAWFEEITAPHKELIHFEESSHYVINEEPGKFVVELVNRVLPFAQAEIGQVKEKEVCE